MLGLGGSAFSSNDVVTSIMLMIYTYKLDQNMWIVADKTLSVDYKVRKSRSRSPVLAAVYYYAKTTKYLLTALTHSPYIGAILNRARTYIIHDTFSPERN